MNSILNPTTKMKTILWSGLVAGVLDAIAGVIVYYIYFKLNPLEVLQFIASGVYGPTAIGGSFFMVIAGTFFHFLIAYVCAVLFLQAYPRIPILRKNAAISGLSFGLGIWLVMNLIILPLSNIPKSPFDPGLATVGIVWHMVLVGLPIAIIIRNFYNSTKENV